MDIINEGCVGALKCQGVGKKVGGIKKGCRLKGLIIVVEGIIYKRLIIIILI